VSEEVVKPNNKIFYTVDDSDNDDAPPLVRARRKRAAKPKSSKRREATMAVRLVEAETPCTNCVMAGEVCLAQLDCIPMRRACSKCHREKRKCVSDEGAAARLHKEATTALLESFMGFKRPAEQLEDDMDVELGNDGEVAAAGLCV